MLPQVKLRPKQLNDALNDYQWRQDTELAVLDASEPLSLPFTEYLHGYAEELGHFGWQHRRFAIETNEGQHIGNCMYYQVDYEASEAEIGVMIGNRAYWDKGYGVAALSKLVEYIFTTTELERAYLRTLDNNVRAQRCFEKCGFARCGNATRDGHRFVLMELSRQLWQEFRGTSFGGEKLATSGG